MEKFLQKCKALWAILTNNRISAKNSETSDMQRMQKNIARQAALTILTVVLTVVILFAMVSAWYTNIAQTSGLTFEAEAWGFKGDITVDNEAIMAAPGDEGIIDLTVENESDSVSALSVTVSKNGMVEEMQKRLFFYVDSRMNRNSETLDRVYLNRFEGYTYNVFNNSNLSLTSDYSNAPVIKWEWVYDVLGYYVLGKPVETLDGEETVKQMHVEEYLRPIVYDFDKATTNINTEGEKIQIEITTVDGKQTPAEFLTAFSKKDGYKGQIDAKKDHAFGNYYKVSVDANGYGVYAYLCNYADIQLENQYDSQLGELAYQKSKGATLDETQEAMLRHNVTVSISAQKDNESMVEVNSITSLKEALSNSETNVIKLTSDVTVTAGETLSIPKNTQMMIDLNGKTLTNVDGKAIVVNEGASLTLANGTLKQDTAKTSGSQGVNVIGAELVMSQMNVEGFYIGVYVGDNTKGNELDSRVYIKNTTIKADTCATFISGNGLVSQQKSLLIVEDSKLYSYSSTICGNGDVSGNGRWGTDIQVIRSEVWGLKTEDGKTHGGGIYQPQKDSTLTVTDSYVEGNNGITLKGGSLKIHNSIIIGAGAYQEAKFTTSGYTDTGDAVYVETKYEYEMNVTITGNETYLGHKDAKSYCIQVYEPNAPFVKVELYGGNYDSANDQEEINNFLAQGYAAKTSTFQWKAPDADQFQTTNCYKVVLKPEQTTEPAQTQATVPVEEQTNEATE